MKKQKVRTA